ncbi:hypothetical protein J27TS8_25250 [Robertmurraya siralis]|uniref:Uncharacterized protein n=1 Tax=Robertmurraya siralis TaxID=77777 RepID=A0A919WIW2_9BACI|nr:hypothetical protein J27TS8_25250 [Robertmurraya siralis]
MPLNLGCVIKSRKILDFKEQIEEIISTIKNLPTPYVLPHTLWTCGAREQKSGRDLSSELHIEVILHKFYTSPKKNL